MTESRQDVYQKVTNRIIADLEKGVTPWEKPWSAGNVPTRPLRHNGIPYQGINVLMLWSEAMDKGFTNPKWLTFRQADELRGHVRKGEHGSLVVYSNSLTKTQHNDSTGEDEEHTIPFLKGYSVFNVDQIDGLPEHYYVKPEPKFQNAIQRNENADQFIKNTGADIKHVGGRAYYASEPDHIRIPPAESFKDAESMYATILHELTHWTRHPTRLDRDLGRKKWGDEGYALEEISAEIGAAGLCADLEITPNVRDDHAQYIASWLKALKNDKRFIFTAASHAQKACDYLHALQAANVAPGPHAQRVLESRAGAASRTASM